MYRLIMFTKVFILIVTLISTFNIAKTQIIPKVSGGDPTDISYYPHSAFIMTVSDVTSYVCGSSILNQKILLTAAHCIELPYRDSCIYTGHTNKLLGDKYRIAAVKKHEHYSKEKVGYDIGLILVTKSIRFSSLVQRVSITRWPPMKNRAAIAGWGLVSENQRTEILHHAVLKVWTYEECQRFMSSLPKDCLCAGSLDGKTYASSGDSGSALIVNNYIQIGLVSFMRPDRHSIVAFSNVSHYYGWIRWHARRLYCTWDY